jgi:hypothetical protein
MVNKIYFNFDAIGSVFFPLIVDEALINAKDAGNVSKIIYCDGALRGCGINFFKSEIICAECRVNRNMIFNKHVKKENNIELIPISTLIDHFGQNISFELDDLSDLESVKKLEYRGINIGLGVVSTFVSVTRNIFPQNTKDLRNALTNLLKASTQIVDLMFKLSITNDFNEIIFCNGRTVTERPLFEFCRMKNVNFNVLELSNSSKYYTFRKLSYGSKMPHDILNNTKLMNDYWDYSDILTDSANEFFYRRRNGLYASDVVYTSGQIPGYNIDSLDETKRNIVVFSGSEDEYFSLGDKWESDKLFSSQLEAFIFIVESLKKHENFFVYIRLHPGLKNIKYSYVRDIANVLSVYKNCEVIEPESKVSSYALLDKCDKCICLGSTIGVEASFWGVPTISIYPSMYNYLDCVYFVDSKVSFLELITMELQPKSRIGALKYGAYFFSQRGDDFKYVNINFRSIKLFGRNWVLNKEYNFIDLILKI